MNLPFPRQNPDRKWLGLIINPLAGLGGKVGLKGSDGLEIQRAALALGAVPEAGERAKHALHRLGSFSGNFELITPPRAMGEWVARACGFKPRVIGSIAAETTTAEDTRCAAQAMLLSGVDLLLFAGGDGTARDICQAVGSAVPVLGIPAGVKIHSAVFATQPQSAGDLALEFLRSKNMRCQEDEVVDLDEAAYRCGMITTRLYGYLKIPFHRQFVQNQKVPTPEGEAYQADAIAAEVCEAMQDGWLYILGPGTTTRAITQYLDLAKTLVGVEVITREQVVARDANENQILEITRHQPTKIIITPIGGQGFLFGRGNQPISNQVIEQVGKENIIIVSLIQKINALRGRPLLVDTGDPSMDEQLSGYFPVITGYHERIIYRVSV